LKIEDFILRDIRRKTPGWTLVRFVDTVLERRRKVTGMVRPRFLVIGTAIVAFHW
jgi:hypothetical protein